MTTKLLSSEQVGELACNEDRDVFVSTLSQLYPYRAREGEDTLDKYLEPLNTDHKVGERYQGKDPITKLFVAKGELSLFEAAESTMPNF